MNMAATDQSITIPSGDIVDAQNTTTNPTDTTTIDTSDFISSIPEDFREKP